MTKRTQGELAPAEAARLIAEVDSEDRERARRAISGGVQAARAQWIPAQHIAEALAWELCELGHSERAVFDVPAYLHRLAKAIEDERDLH